MTIHINPQTGEAVQWDGAAWQTLQTARNPETGEVKALVGSEWQTIKPQPPERGTVEKVERSVGLFGKGMNDAIGAGVGALPDAVGWLLRQGGLPSSKPGQYTEWAQGALNALGRNDTPETTGERVAYGAGQGVGNAATVLLPGAAAAKFAPAGSMAQGIGQTVSKQPITQLAAGAAGGAVTEATDNPVYGMGAALAVPAAVSLGRALISPGATRMNPEMQRLVGVAEAERIPLTSGQATGSRPMRAMESVFGTLPSTAGRQDAVTQAQREAFNRAVLARAGVSGENLATPDVLQGAKSRIGTELQTIAGRNTMNVDAPTMQNVQQLAQDARRYLTNDQAKPMLARINDFIDKIQISGNTASVEGAAYAKLDSALARQIRSTTDGPARDALTGLRDTLRRAMDASITGQDAAAWQEARRQYANYKTVEAAMNLPSAATAAGNIPPAALATALARGPQSNFAMGRGDLNDLSRVGRAFVQDAIPNSGTPERNYMINLLTGGGAAGSALAAGGSPTTAALSAAAMLGGPRVAQEVYMAPLVQAYLKNQLANSIIPKVDVGAIQGISAAQAKALLDRN